MSEQQEIFLKIKNKKLKVFTDFHHASLLNSLIMLFEKRLGGEVYRPIGTEWHTQGFWKVYDHPATAAQYLGVGAATPDDSEPLNDTEGRPSVFGIYWCKDIDSGSVNKGITLEAFMRNDFDIVIASLPQHIEPFKRLCQMHPSRPKLIYQIGNQWDLGPEGLAIDGIMASAKIANPFGMKNWVSYHQEFDTQVFYPYGDCFSPVMDTTGFLAPDSRPSISSYVNCFDVADHFRSDWALFQKIEKLMPGWNFESHGGQCRDGALGPARVLASDMQRNLWIWHTKNGGDGYGHIIHNAAAVGRPLIVRKSYYQGKLAEDLLIDGVTCIDIDQIAPDKIPEAIEYYSLGGRWEKMCQEIYHLFRQTVNFEKEALEIATMLHNIGV